MKKIKFIILATMLAMAISAPAFAATIVTGVKFSKVFYYDEAKLKNDSITMEISVTSASSAHMIISKIMAEEKYGQLIMKDLPLKWASCSFNTNNLILVCTAFVGDLFGEDGLMIDYTSTSFHLELTYDDGVGPVYALSTEELALSDIPSLKDIICDSKPDAEMCASDVEKEDPIDPTDSKTDTDYESDGFNDDVDNCPLEYNSDQANSDGDDFGDACDLCKFVKNTDEDGDGVADACGDSDMDGDGVKDSLDNCPSVANADQANSDGDFKGDACDYVPSVITTGTGYTGTGGLSATGACTLSSAAIPSSNGIAQAFILAFVAMGLAIGRVAGKK